MKKCLFALFIALLSFGQVFAKGSQTAKINVVVHPKSVGSGTIYVADESDINKGTSFESSSSANTNYQFYIHATSNEDSEFVGWYDEEGWPVSNATKYPRQIKRPTSASTGTNERTFYAKFIKKPTACDVTYKVATDGSYIYKYGSETAVPVSEDVTVNKAQKVTLTATANSGKRFLGWYKKNAEGDVEKYISTNNPETFSFTEQQIIGCTFVDESLPTFALKSELDGTEPITLYTSLQAAITAANANSANANGTNKIVAVVANGTVDENVTIPSGVTLLVPFSVNYDCIKETPVILHGWKRQNPNGYTTNDENGDAIQEYRKLTIGTGKTITVSDGGAISLSAPRWAQFWRLNKSGVGKIWKYFGGINMLSNSQIILNSGSNLYCWGSIYGEGSVTANSGSTIYETFTFTDWRDDGKMANLINTKCFAINQYYIQDIQVPIIFKHGAKEIVKTAMVYYSGKDAGQGQLEFIGGSDALFYLSNANDTIIKYYSVAEDRLNFDVKGSVELRDFSLNITGKGNFKSDGHVFTVTNNWTMNVLRDTLKVNIDMSLAPGSRLNIEKNAIVEVQSTKSLYVCDAEFWGQYAARRKVIPLVLPINGVYADADLCDYSLYKSEKSESEGATTTASSTYKILKTRAENALVDAEVKVDGKLIIKGGSSSTFSNTKCGLFTGGSASAGGAKIYSTPNGEGSIIYESELGDQPSIPYYPTEGGMNLSQEDMPITPAKLQNGDGTYTSTAGRPANTTFAYEDGKWLVKKDELKIEVEAEEKQVIATGDQVNTSEVTVKETGTLEVKANAEVVTSTLALSATPSDIDDLQDGQAGKSSQITGSGSIVAENVYIDIKMNKSGTMDASRYYAFAVPFKVAIADGVEKVIGSTTSLASLETDYRAYTYNGVKRAKSGKGSNWDKVTASTDEGYFLPGTFYLIEFADNSCNVFRFYKATGEQLNNKGNIDLNENASSQSTDAGWNGIANNALQNATIGVTGTDAAQVLNADGNGFMPVNLSQVAFAIGMPMFVQAGSATEAVVTASSSAAPARMLAQTNDVTYGNYTIRIKAEGANKMADQLFISASENAKSEYVIGKDLTKMFLGNAIVAQLWVNDYNKKLAMNQAVLVDDVAEASLTLYAPKAGNYTVYLKDIPEDVTIYLVADGLIVANLNEGAYTTSLAKGENTQYGLRINTKTIPGVFTSIDEALISGDGVRKVLLNGNVYIIREGKMFNAQGQEL